MTDVSEVLRNIPHDGPSSGLGRFEVKKGALIQPEATLSQDNRSRVNRGDMDFNITHVRKYCNRRIPS
jgi:hypothetical protein